MNRFGIIGNKKEVLDNVASIKKKYPQLQVNNMYFLDVNMHDNTYHSNLANFVRNNENVVLLSPIENLKSSILDWVQYRTPIYLDFSPDLSYNDADILAKACDEANATIMVKSVYPYALSLKRDLGLTDRIQCVNFRRHGIGELISRTEILKDLTEIINILGHKVKSYDVSVYKNKLGKNDGYIIDCILSCYGFYKANVLWNIASLYDYRMLDIYSENRYLSINLGHTSYETEPELSKSMEKKIEHKRDIMRFFDIVSRAETENSFRNIADSLLIVDKIFSKL
ncbi:MAG: hypothetical protein ACK5L5_06260 [Bacteroidales bacterium]